MITPRLGFTLSLILAGLITLNASSSWSKTPVDRHTYIQALRLHNEGVVLIQMQKYSEAMDKFKEAIELDPDLTEAHCNYANMLMHFGKMEEAKTEFQRTVDLNPNLAVAWQDLGTCDQSLGMSEAAVLAYKKYLALDPNGSNASKVRSAMAMIENEIARTANNPVQDGPNDYLGEATQNGMTRWAAQMMPIKIYIKPSETVPNYRPAFETILKQCFDEWTLASNKLVSFAYVKDEGSANIVCYWTNDPKEMMSSAEGGHAMVIPDEHNIARAKIILLTINPGDGPVSDKFAKRVYLHEIGHSLGLLGHSKNPHDIMFCSLPVGAPDGTYESILSDHDRNTLIALYTADQAKMNSRPLDLSHLLMSGDPTTLVVRVAKLNAEAAEAMKNKNFTVAISKLEEARTIDPNNELILGNLGSAYGNCAAMAIMMHNTVQAQMYFDQALPFLAKGRNKGNYATVLKNYYNMLVYLHKNKEAEQINKKIQTLEVKN